MNEVEKFDLGPSGRQYIRGIYESFARELPVGNGLPTYWYVLPRIIKAEIDFSEGAVYAFLPSPLEDSWLDKLDYGHLSSDCWEPFFRHLGRYIEHSCDRFLFAEILASDDEFIRERFPHEDFSILKLESHNKKSFVYFACYWGVDGEEIPRFTSCCDIGSDCYGLLVENADVRRLRSGTVVSLNYLRSICRASDMVYTSVCDHETRIFWERDGFGAE